ncbi:MAG TPA: hypothetical protein VE571_11150, partial [Solirubrobacteraceae bacterium]|nr:hypothetical protein [Solirubrobacteraceae bacterium]
SMTFRLARLSALVAMLGAALALTAPAAAAARTPGLQLGFTDYGAFEFAKGTERQAALQHAKESGASIIRLGMDWDATSKTKPPSLAVERDPSWSGYDWSDTDSTVRSTAAAGLTPLMLISNAPAWAEGPNRPQVSIKYPTGTWRPSAADYGAFSQAAAKRYSGTYPDPENPGQNLPRVKYWQGWNEPNLSLYLTPQWTRSGGKLHDTSADIFRGLLNAFYKGVKAVSKTNVVVTAGTSPFGDPPGGQRIQPALYWRDVFCLRGRTALKKVRCPGSPVHFDVLAHHPYPIGPPRRHSPVADDVVIADFDRLEKPLKAAVRKGTVLPRGNKQLWATELSWDSKPPDPHGIPERLQAIYMEGAFSELWTEGVSAVIWFNMRDQFPNPDYDSTLQSGIYFRGDTIAEDIKKISFTSYSFPFTAYVKKGRTQLWGLAPAAGNVTIQAQSGSSWKTVAHVNARPDRLFAGTARVKAGKNVRAVQGTATSLAWKVFTP